MGRESELASDVQPWILRQSARRVGQDRSLLVPTRVLRSAAPRPPPRLQDVHAPPAWRLVRAVQQPRLRLPLHLLSGAVASVARANAQASPIRSVKRDSRGAPRLGLMLADCEIYKSLECCEKCYSVEKICEISLTA